RGGFPGDLDAETLGDLGGDVDVEALVLTRLVVERGLRRVGRVGGDLDLAPLTDLGEESVVAVLRAYPLAGGALAARAGRGGAGVVTRRVGVTAAGCEWEDGKEGDGQGPTGGAHGDLFCVCGGTDDWNMPPLAAERSDYGPSCTDC